MRAFPGDFLQGSVCSRKCNKKTSRVMAAGSPLWRRGRDSNPRTFRVTRFPSVRAKPATRPLRKAGELYHNEKNRATGALHQIESYFQYIRCIKKNVTLRQGILADEGEHDEPTKQSRVVSKDRSLMSTQSLAGPPPSGTGTASTESGTRPSRGTDVAQVQRLRSRTHFSMIETTSSGLLIMGT